MSPPLALCRLIWGQDWNHPLDTIQYQDGLQSWSLVSFLSFWIRARWKYESPSISHRPAPSINKGSPEELLDTSIKCILDVNGHKIYGDKNLMVKFKWGLFLRHCSATNGSYKFIWKYSTSKFLYINIFGTVPLEKVGLVSLSMLLVITKVCRWWIPYCK